jgi:predicted dienelactone hydrolase
MAKKLPLFVLFSLLIGHLFGQYQIGHTTITFTDASRANRAIQTEIYYPASVAGDNVAMPTGTFPVVNFGHGFLMIYAAYQNVWEALVPAGYIVCLPRTEGNISPNHGNFAKDLAFLVTAMKTQNTTVGSIFKGHVKNKFAVAGHSMGGGAAVLAVQYNTAINALAVLAPAETNPSAKAAAANITKPALVFAGSVDCVTPIAQHAQPIYDSLASSCKTFVNLTGASHCQFANSNFNCSLGEGGCTAPSITRTQQQALVNSLLLPWLDFQLKTDCNRWGTFQSLITASSGFVAQQQCGGSVTCLKPKTPLSSNITTTAATLVWTPSACNGTYDLQWRPTSTSVWTSVNNLSAATYNLTNLSPNTAYKWRVRSRCSPIAVGISGYTAISTFSTVTNLASSNGEKTALSISNAVFPNPVEGTCWLTVDNAPENARLTIHVRDVFGKTVLEQTEIASYEPIAMQTNNLVSGAYWVAVDWENGGHWATVIVKR